ARPPLLQADLRNFRLARLPLARPLLCRFSGLAQADLFGALMSSAIKVSARVITLAPSRWSPRPILTGRGIGTRARLAPAMLAAPERGSKCYQAHPCLVATRRMRFRPAPPPPVPCGILGSRRAVPAFGICSRTAISTEPPTRDRRGRPLVLLVIHYQM